MSWTLGMVLSVAALIGTSIHSKAVPITYSYDDSAAGGFAGSGVFTLDVGAPLGRHDATGVAGSGDAFGRWSAVSFHAHPGNLPMLVISNLVGASIGLSLPGIGGGEIQPGSFADAEWLHFIDAAARLPNPFRIVPLSAPVPDGGPSLVWPGVAVVGMLAWARARSEGKERPFALAEADLGTPRRAGKVAHASQGPV